MSISLQTNYWTGVGTRSLTPEEEALAQEVGARLTKLGYHLLSGGATGADTEFHRGVCSVDPALATIYLPYDGFKKHLRPTGSEGSMFITIGAGPWRELAGNYLKETGIYTGWDHVPEYSREFHGRNYYQAFHHASVTQDEDGNFIQPRVPFSRFGVYFADVTRTGKVKGGTRTAIELLQHHGRRTYNLRDPEQRVWFMSLLEQAEAQQ
ncbi:hypothetical protein [Pseudoalteromonas phage J2-1_QLiu-2017]|nr:hypothetical protein [Pseudoalteromonas phage J2-1_QLiu-2017]